MTSRALPALLLLAACGAGDDPAPGSGPASGPGRATPQAGPRSPGDWRLAARRQRALDDKPEWVLAEDLDGDGRPQLAAATLVPGELIGLGEEGGPERYRVPIGGYPLRPIPRPGGQVVVASREDVVLRWVDTTAEVGVLPLPAVPRALAVGDLGADGTEELVLACDGRRLLTTTADAPGTLAETALTDELPRCLLVVGDGRGVLVGAQSTRSLALHGYADGVLGSEVERVQLPGIPRDLQEGDLDGDGDAELLVVGGEEHLWVFGWGAPGGADAWFEAEPLTWHVSSIPIAARIDGGQVHVLHVGRLELIVLDQLTPTGGRRRAGYAGQTPRDLATLDVEGDGNLEVAIANRDSRAISLLDGGPGGPRFATRAPVGGFPNGVVAGDLNRDGRTDVVTLDSKSSTVTPLLAAGDRLRPLPSVAVGESPRGGRLTDLDRDGHLDLVLLSVDAAGGRLVRLFGDGTGRLARRGQDMPAGFAPRDVQVVGERLVVVDDERDELLLLSRTGELRWRGALASGPSAVEVVEFDGDPGPELAIALGGTGRTGVVFGEIAGDVFRELHHAPVVGAPFDLARADLDGDGRLDLVALLASEPGAKKGAVQPVFLDAAGGVQLGTPVMVSLAPRHVVAGDLDGDGGAEVLVAAQFAHVVDLFTCRGRALVPRDAVGLGIGPMALALLDADGDGVLDLAGANGHSDDVSLARGLFVEAP